MLITLHLTPPPVPITCSTGVASSFLHHRLAIMTEGCVGFHVCKHLSLSLSLFHVSLLLWFQLGTRHILEAMRGAGHDVNTLFLCGGLSKNPLFVQLHANATG